MYVKSENIVEISKAYNEESGFGEFDAYILKASHTDEKHRVTYLSGLCKWMIA